MPSLRSALGAVVATLVVVGTFPVVFATDRRVFASATHDPIFLEGDAGFTSANGVVGGTGTSLDPFLFTGWEIRAGPRNGIEIRNTTAAFLIRTVHVHDADYDRFGIYLLNVTGARLENSSVSSNNWVGIRIEKSRSIVLENNYFDKNSGAGVSLVDTVDVVVRDNVFSRNVGGGLGLGGSERTSIVNNVFERNYLGGIFWDGSAHPSGSGWNTSIGGNRFTANGVDIDLVEAANVTVTANKIDGTNGPGSSGVFFRRARDITIAANNVSTHSGDGFVFWNSSNVTLAGNTIRDNNGYGLYLYSSASFLIHQNDFVTNWDQVRLDENSALVWNRSYPLGGNHWSDYMGSDICTGMAQDVCTGPDGFGDTPYVIDYTNGDRYPLMTPHGLPRVSPIASLLSQPLVGNTTTNFALNASFSWDLNDPVSSLEFRWDWNSDGTWDTAWTEETVGVHRYDLPGVYSARVQVRDSENLTDDVNALIVVYGFAASPSSAFPAVVFLAVIASVSIAIGFTLFLIRRRRRNPPHPGAGEPGDRRG